MSNKNLVPAVILQMVWDNRKQLLLSLKKHLVEKTIPYILYVGRCTVVQWIKIV